MDQGLMSREVRRKPLHYNEILQQTEYNFIKTNEHLGKHVILLGLAGSYSYGTNIDTSDIDIRGITLNQKSDMIGLPMFVAG